jgi:gas vesicle protein
MQGLRPSGPGFAQRDGRVAAPCSILWPFPRRATHGTHRALCFAVEAKISSKIDAASEAEDLAAKVTEVADKAGDAARDSQGKVEEAAKRGGHRLQETAKKAGHVAQEVATKVTHSAQETVQKVVHRAKEVANTAEHRRQEHMGKAGDKPKEP